jgi:hypothetical protein
MVAGVSDCSQDFLEMDIDGLRMEVAHQEAIISFLTSFAGFLFHQRN